MSATVIPAGRRGGRPSRRDEIVHAALEAFAATGYHNTSLNDIADQLGMTAAGILHHFKTKENLLVEVLKYRDSIGPMPDDASGSALFRSLLTTIHRNVERPGLTQLYAVLSAESLTHEHPGQEWFRERYQVLRFRVEEALSDIVGPDVDPAAIANGARAIIATMDGLQVQWLLQPDTQPMKPALVLVIDSVIDHLSPV